MGSARQSKPLPFSCALGVLGNGGAGNVPKRLRCPPHIHVDFEACFFEPPRASNAAAEGANDAGSPYVGTIDLDSFYFQHLERLVADDEKVTSGAVLPRFPGYEVPRAGQIQLCVKNQHSTAIKVFLIPYNLAGIERDGRGGRTFLRQKSHIVIGDRQEGGLRYAVHLQFCAPPPSASKLGVKEQQRYYLHRHIRVVFASQHALSPAEKLRVVAEGPQGVLDAKGSAPMKVEAFAPFKLDAHVLNAWNALRREAKLALKRQKGDVQPDDPMQVDKPAPSVKDVEMADVAESWKRYHAELSAPIDPNGAVSPNELAVAQQQRYTLNGSPLSHSPSMEAPPSEQATMSTLQRLDFARVSRPPTPSRAASPSQPSGLSMSRPSSRAETRILRTSTPDSSR